MAAPAASLTQRNHDVFLSFRGEDTRRNFTDHLYYALIDAGIKVFRDDEGLPRGERISDQLKQAIHSSKISIVVFSRNYASSRWCLEELEKIMDCKNRSTADDGGHGQVVLPVFYDVHPSDVRHQRGTFADAFVRHEGRYAGEVDKVAAWRAALSEAANLSGYDLNGVANGYEGKFIKKIVEETLKQLDEEDLYVVTHEVGLDWQVEEVNNLLDIGAEDDRRLVGICGMSGVGKTTLAKKLYNQYICHRIFEGKSFLDVGEVLQQSNGKVQLQEQLLADVLKRKIEVQNVHKGKKKIKEMLSAKRVLLVLDNVQELEQVNLIAESRDWFGFGTRIIVTTTNERLLEQLNVEKKYIVKEMILEDSLELFSWHAFKKSDPDETYADLSKEVVHYCRGLPLALEVMGCYLRNASREEWESELIKMREIPVGEMQEKLRLSYEKLPDDDIKGIFLDVACFFCGMEKDYVVEVLKGCGFYPEPGIRALVKRRLLKIDKASDKLEMHQQVREMGRNIVRQEAPRKPWDQSRVWRYKDAARVLRHKTGSKKVEGLALRSRRDENMTVVSETFRKMKSLRLLQLDYVQIKGGFEHFPPELCLLCWHGFPLDFIPNEMCQESLVSLDLRYSSLRRVWNDCQKLEKLKFLFLSHSQNLTRTPDFSYLPNLVVLYLDNCTSLEEIHPSVGNLQRLMVLDLTNCRKLQSLPSSLWKLKELKTFHFTGCDCILLPRISLNHPVDIASCSSQSLSCLDTLNLGYCNLSDDTIPKDLWELCSLRMLCLVGNNFSSLPSGLNNLKNLQGLVLSNCSSLQTIPELPESLLMLWADGCTSLTRLPDVSKLDPRAQLYLCDCGKLKLDDTLDMTSDMCQLVFQESPFYGRNTSEFSLAGTLQLRFFNATGGWNLPWSAFPEQPAAGDWHRLWRGKQPTYSSLNLFEVHMTPGVRLIVPQWGGNLGDFVGLVVSCVFSYNTDAVAPYQMPWVTCTNYTKAKRRVVSLQAARDKPTGEHLWIGNFGKEIIELDCGDRLEVIPYFGEDVTMKRVRVVLQCRRLAPPD